MNTVDTTVEYRLYAQAYGSTQWNQAPKVLLMVSYDLERVKEMEKTLRGNGLLSDFVIEHQQQPSQLLYPR
jgi:hypothetical protein